MKVLCRSRTLQPLFRGPSGDVPATSCDGWVQLNIFSFKTSLNQLWPHQLEHNYSTIFLQETNYKEGNLLGNFKHWKVTISKIFKNKSLRFGVGTLLTPSVNNIFRDDLIRDDLEIV